MRDLLEILRNVIRSRMISIVTKLKYWTNLSYIRSRIFEKLKQFFRRLTDIRPRNSRDYFPVPGYLVSKRLAFLIVIGIGIVNLYYLLYINPPQAFTEGAAQGVRVYSYRSLPLRFYKGKVKIRAKSGYIAYEGEVHSGRAKGQGVLYDERGRTVYEGSFEENDFEGEGTLYQTSGTALYAGEFSKNVFQGQGKLYRKNGSLLYKGEFAGGKQEGEGTLYDASQAPVFTGLFHGGEIVYSQLLGKTASEISQIYTGRKSVFTYNGEYAVWLADIGAVYMGNTDGADGMKAEKILVCRDSFVYAGELIESMSGAKNKLGEPAFTGNSYMTFPEAAGLSRLEEQGADTIPASGLTSVQPYEDVHEVISFNDRALVWLTVFTTEDLTYTLVGQTEDGDFLMYQLERTNYENQ